MFKNKDRAALAESFGVGDYLTAAELRAIGFVQVGQNTKISRKCSFYGISGHIGDNVRVDDFCILKGHIELWPFCHIASYVMISGVHGPVVVGDFVGLAARTTVLSGTDDYNADTLGCPETPDEYCTRIKGPVTFEIGAMVGAHCVIFPNVVVGRAASIGAGCIVGKSVPDGGVLRAPKAELKTWQRNVDRITDFARRVWENREGVC